MYVLVIHFSERWNRDEVDVTGPYATEDQAWAAALKALNEASDEEFSTDDVKAHDGFAVIKLAK